MPMNRAFNCGWPPSAPKNHAKLLKMSSPAANPTAPPVNEPIPGPAAASAWPIDTGPASTLPNITTGVTISVRIIRIAWSASTATTLMKPPKLA